MPKILFIDDDNFFLEFYRAEFAQYNFQIDFAHDGEEGLRKVRETKPDLVLLDVILPKKNGFEVLQELKSDEETKNIPVVIISILRSESDVKKLLGLGAIRTFDKLTYLPKDVADYVQKVLEEDFGKKENVSKKAGTKLSAEETNKIFIESMKEVESLLSKLFDKKINLEDINVTLIPFKKFEEQIQEISKQTGAILIYSRIDADVPGLAFLRMAKNDTINLVKLMEKSTIGKEIGLSMNDKVVEEFFNIATNVFLTKMGLSIPGRYLLQSPVITNPNSIIEIINKAKIPENNLVTMLKESFTIEDLDLNFSIFIVFDKELFKKIN